MKCVYERIKKGYEKMKKWISMYVIRVFHASCVYLYCEYMYVHMYVLYMCVSVYVCVCVYVYVCVCVFVCARVRVCRLSFRSDVKSSKFKCKSLMSIYVYENVKTRKKGRRWKKEIEMFSNLLIIYFYLPPSFSYPTLNIWYMFGSLLYDPSPVSIRVVFT